MPRCCFSIGDVLEKHSSKNKAMAKTIGGV
jgi:hypothetical protein